MTCRRRRIGRRRRLATGVQSARLRPALGIRRTAALARDRPGRGRRRSSSCSSRRGSSLPSPPRLHARRTGPIAIFQADAQVDADPLSAFRRLRRLGVERVRVFVPWGAAPPRAGSLRTPRRARRRLVSTPLIPAPTRRRASALYDAIDRAAAADRRRGLLRARPPAPAVGVQPATPRRPLPQWRPSARDFGQFVRMMGVRYSGHVCPARSDARRCRASTSGGSGTSRTTAPTSRRRRSMAGASRSPRRPIARCSTRRGRLSGHRPRARHDPVRRTRAARSPGVGRDDAVALPARAVLRRRELPAAARRRARRCAGARRRPPARTAFRGRTSGAVRCHRPRDASLSRRGFRRTTSHPTSPVTRILPRFTAARAHARQPASALRIGPKAADLQHRVRIQDGPPFPAASARRPPPPTSTGPSTSAGATRGSAPTTSIC